MKRSDTREVHVSPEPRAFLYVFTCHHVSRNVSMTGSTIPTSRRRTSIRSRISDHRLEGRAQPERDVRHQRETPRPTPICRRRASTRSITTASSGWKRGAIRRSISTPRIICPLSRRRRGEHRSAHPFPRVRHPRRPLARRGWGVGIAGTQRRFLGRTADDLRSGNGARAGSVHGSRRGFSQGRPDLLRLSARHCPLYCAPTTPGNANGESYNAAVDMVDRNVAEGRGGKIAFIDPARRLTYGELAEQRARASARCWQGSACSAKTASR